MICSNCNDRGYIDGFVAEGGTFRPQISICPVCNNYAKYSARIKEIHDAKKIEQRVVAEQQAKSITPRYTTEGNLIIIDFKNKTKS